MKTYYISSDNLPYNETMVQLWKRSLRLIWKYGYNEQSSRIVGHGQLEETKALELLIRCDQPPTHITFEYPHGELYNKLKGVESPVSHIIKEDYCSQVLGIRAAKGFDYDEGKEIKDWLPYVIEELHNHKHSRRGVIAIFKQEDTKKMSEGYEVPCPLSIKYSVDMHNKLNSQIVFRSIDHVSSINDFYAFRQLQLKKVAKELNYDFGWTSFYLMNAHIRKDNFPLVERWIKEMYI